MNRLIRTLESTRVSNLIDEKLIQSELEDILSEFGFIREYVLSKESIVDFYNPTTKQAIEIKVKGSAMSIYRQVERYCMFECVDSIILLTAKTMNLPIEINGKPTFVVSLGKAWL
jgi:hypothetical protein